MTIHILFHKKNQAIVKNRLLFILLFGAFITSCQNKQNSGMTENIVDSTGMVVKPTVVTQASENDTDDPAIWINKADPSQSLILGTDKGDLTGGIYVYTLDGKIDSSRSIFNMKRPNNIDIEYGMNINGVPTDIAVCTERGRNMIRIFALPSMKPIDKGGIEVFVGEKERDPMGIGLYKDPKTGIVYAIVGRKSGPDSTYLWQYRLDASTNGSVSGSKVRAFGRFIGNAEIEAIVVDDALGHIYYSNEMVGIRQYYASPEKGNDELALFAKNGVREDHEGLSIYSTSATTGYILLSDQQANRLRIYSREGTKENPYDHKLLKIVNVAAMESDGSDITEVPINDTFKHGLFIAMSTDKTFHFYRWEDIAGKDLKIAR
jgi:3-phytase